jgi:glutamate formiminotransferase/formiminotetrahydrofolate cyclodeaminase
VGFTEQLQLSLTVGKKDYEGVWQELTSLADQSQKIKDQLLIAVDDDTDAFNDYMEARRLPQNNAEEKRVRKEAIEEGLKQAVRVPLGTAQLSLDALKIAKRIVEIGNVNSITDAGVGVQIAFTGVRGGIFNVLINLPHIKDQVFIEEMKKTCVVMEKEAEALLNKTMIMVKEAIKKL